MIFNEDVINAEQDLMVRSLVLQEATKLYYCFHMAEKLGTVAILFTEFSSLAGVLNGMENFTFMDLDELHEILSSMIKKEPNE